VGVEGISSAPLQALTSSKEEGEQKRGDKSRPGGRDVMMSGNSFKDKPGSWQEEAGSVQGQSASISARI